MRVPPLLLLALLVTTTAGKCPWYVCFWNGFGAIEEVYRKVIVDGTLSCLPENGAVGEWLPLDLTRISLMEQDMIFDDVVKETLTHEGRFRFEETDWERKYRREPDYLQFRFYLKVDVLCWHPQNGPSRFLTFCKDKKIKERCAAATADEYGYKYATFTHAFEKNPGGEVNLKDAYNLNCTLGFKNDQEEHDGLTCTGGLCKSGQRCGIELKKKRSVAN
ncbi:hypothetical protein PRIPAC_87462 [Pristionchus pacificus]|uniref:Uncharacterized protein n=1 Tax=Pristionchus pacificus TaxID=54126 RepID=A0A2A6CVV3_PRIPA|nr:hypothetical protein PRIPAC_87462 [Pristionchus pacificus]|eukprot:PDM82206.1 hypothetical protein PRIPAC_36599 [Pristionchus pacificus]